MGEGIFQVKLYGFSSRKRKGVGKRIFTTTTPNGIATTLIA